MQVNCNSLRDFIKILGTLQNEVLFHVERGGTIGVISAGGGGQSIVRVTMTVPGVLPEEAMVVGVSVPTMKSMLPKSVDSVTIDMAKDEITLTSTGHRATLRTIVREQCAQEPRKPMMPIEQVIVISPQAFYEVLTDLDSAFDGKKSNKAFAFEVTPEKPGVITLFDEDTAVGSLEHVVCTLTPLTIVMDESYAYDLALEVFNSIRLLCDTVELRFVKMPSDNCHALMVVGRSRHENCPFEFSITIAARKRI